MDAAELSQLSNRQLRNAMLAAARLDAEIATEAWLRCHTQAEGWGDDAEVFVYSNGSGDDLFVVFVGDMLMLKGFDHESPVSPHARDEYAVWEGMYEGLPAALAKVLEDASIVKEHVTFCYWRVGEQGPFVQGPVRFDEDEDDGSGFLLGCVPRSAQEFIEWARDYYYSGDERLSEARVVEVYRELMSG